MRRAIQVAIGTAVVAVASPAAAQQITFIPSEASSAAWEWRVRPNVHQAAAMLSANLDAPIRPGDHAEVECEIGPDLYPLRRCRVIVEQPPGRGIARGAAGIAVRYQAMSKDAAGVSTVGRRFRIAIGRRPPPE